MATKAAVDSGLQVNENDTQVHIKGAWICLYHGQTYCTLYRDEIRRAGIPEPSDGIKYLEAPTDNDMYGKSGWKKAIMIGAYTRPIRQRSVQEDMGLKIISHASVVAKTITEDS